MTPRLTALASLLVVGLACRERPSRLAVPDQPAVEGSALPTPPPVRADPYVEWNLPTWVHEALRGGNFRERYEVFTGLNPYYQRGRFDGDAKSDIAILIREKSTGKRGIAIIHRFHGAVFIVGAGQPFGNGGDDFSWLGVWRVEERDVVNDPSVQGPEVLFVEKPESAGGVISWNGTTYVWTQAGD